MVPVTRVTVPWLALPTAVTLSVWLGSLAGPALLLAVRVLAAKLNAVSSAVVLASAVAVGASLTSVTVTLTVPVALLGSATPSVVPLSATVYILSLHDALPISGV